MVRWIRVARRGVKKTRCCCCASESGGCKKAAGDDEKGSLGRPIWICSTIGLLGPDNTDCRPTDGKAEAVSLFAAGGTTTEEGRRSREEKSRVRTRSLFC